MSRLDPTANRVVLRPRFFDRECVFLLVMPALGSLVLAVLLILHTPKPETVHCDRAAQTCTYFQAFLDDPKRPTFDALLPRTLTKPVKDLRLVENVERRDIGRGQTAKFARFELRDTSGKLVFRYRTLYDKKSRAKLDGDMKLLADFIQSS